MEISIKRIKERQENTEKKRPTHKGKYLQKQSNNVTKVLEIRLQIRQQNYEKKNSGEKSGVREEDNALQKIGNIFD